MATESSAAKSAWSKAEVARSSRMRSAGTRLAVFVHGSFVGDDPLALARTLEGAVPVLPDLARALRGFTRAQVSRFLGDLSNFPRDYVDTLATATGIEATDFTWSGENHHAARVQEAVRLARVLATHGGSALDAEVVRHHFDGCDRLDRLAEAHLVAEQHPAGPRREQGTLFLIVVQFDLEQILERGAADAAWEGFGHYLAPPLSVAHLGHERQHVVGDN